MAKLYNQKTDELITELTATQLQFLIDQLEEEHDKDKDYFLTPDTLAMLRAADGDPELLGLLEKAMGDAGELDIIWK